MICRCNGYQGCRHGRPCFARVEAPAPVRGLCPACTANRAAHIEAQRGLIDAFNDHTRRLDLVAEIRKREAAARAAVVLQLTRNGLGTHDLAAILGLTQQRLQQLVRDAKDAEGKPTP